MQILKYVIDVNVDLGYLFYKKIRCSGGFRPITSIPYGSALHGGVPSALIAEVF